jgi:hypothetical protein
MTDLGDLKLDRIHESAEPERRRKLWLVVLLVCLIAVIGAIAWNVFTRLRTPPSRVQVKTDSAVASRSPERPKPVAGDDLPLPPLAETDSVVRELVNRLSSHPKVVAWLTTDQLIRNFTVVVVNIAHGQNPSKHLGAVRPAGAFSVKGDGDMATIDPRSYRRYDGYADAVAGLDPEGTARLYATLKPRIQDAYRELGYPEGDFDAMLERAIVHLLNTPVIEGDVRLVQKSVAYEFADSRLQGLSDAQRQFLRMGPRNVRIIQTRLREMAPYLGIPPEELPR